MTMGRIASYYYLHYTTMQLFTDAVNSTNDIPSLLSVLTRTAEYKDLPVRHNEEKLNAQLAAECPWAVDARTLDSPHTKAHLLLQAHFSHLDLPISDYITDTKSVLDQAVRIIQAMVDVSADGGWLFTALNCMQLLQMVLQGQWFEDSTLLVLPHFNSRVVEALNAKKIECMPELLALGPDGIRKQLTGVLSDRHIKDVLRVCGMLPIVKLGFELSDDLSPGEDAMLKVELTRLSKTPTGGIYAPRFPKHKDEGWWLVLGDPATGELIALRRVNFPYKATKTTLSFEVPEEPGKYRYSLYLMSDSYIGLDQQYDIDFVVNI